MKQDLVNKYIKDIEEYYNISKSFFPYIILQNKKTLLYSGVKILNDGVHTVIVEGLSSAELVEEQFKYLDIIK